MLALLAACSFERPVHTCDEWEDCGLGGACEPGTGACSFADAACSSGRRFSEYAPAEYADACVEIVNPGARGQLCEPNTCGFLRECIGNRCVSVDSLTSNSNFFGAHCASGLSGNEGWIELWGNVSFGQLVLHYPGFNSCVFWDCPRACLECKADCPLECRSPTPDPAVCTECAADCINLPASCGGSAVVTGLTVGDNHFCITNPETYCFGANNTYQVGDPMSTSPQAASDEWLHGPCDMQDPRDCQSKGYSLVSAGNGHTCASFPFGGAVECWGDNTFGQRGGSVAQPHLPARLEPFPLGPGEEPLTIGQLSASGRFTCAATSNRVACWGDTPTTPQGIVGDLTGGSITALETGHAHACVIDAKRVKCWGANEAGQSAPRDQSSNVAPTVVLPELEFVSVTAGRAHTCAVTTTGLTYCWGDASFGQLGEGVAGPGPALIQTPTAVGPIAASDDATCAVQLDDHVRCWGATIQIGAEHYDDREICLELRGD